MNLLKSQIAGEISGGETAMVREFSKELKVNPIPFKGPIGIERRSWLYPKDGYLVTEDVR